MKFTSKVGDVKILKLKSQSKSYKFSQKSCGSFQSSLEPIVYLSWLMYYLKLRYLFNIISIFLIIIIFILTSWKRRTRQTLLFIFLIWSLEEIIRLEKQHHYYYFYYWTTNTLQFSGNSSASWKIDWGLECKISVCCGFVNFVLVC